MTTRKLPLVTLTVLLPLVGLLGACGDDPGGERGVDEPVAENGLATVRLTDDLGCGFGFARVDASGEALLTIYHQPDAGRISRTVELPSPDWEAQVVVGRHLDANWCNDVIEEPTADVEETWTVVEGTLTFDGTIPAHEWDGTTTEQPVVARLTDAVVEGPDGERVDLDDVALSNSSWGFLAG